MSKKLKTVLLSVAVATMMLCANIKVSAADVVDMEIGGGHRTVCVFGQAIEIMSNDYILILPNNDTLRMDIMLNGTVTKGLKSLRISKVDKDSVLLEEGSHIIKCSSEEQVNSVGTQLSQQTSVSQIKMDKMTGVGNAVYTVEENGQIKDSSGNVVNQNNFPVRTTSIKEEIKQFEEKVDERIKAKQEEESKPVYVPQPEPEKVVEKKSESSKDNNKGNNTQGTVDGDNEDQSDIIEPETQDDDNPDTPKTSETGNVNDDQNGKIVTENHEPVENSDDGKGQEIVKDGDDDQNPNPTGGEPTENGGSTGNNQGDTLIPPEKPVNPVAGSGDGDGD